MINRIAFIACLIILTLASCESKPKGEAVVQVFDRTLLEEELYAQIDDNLSREDSATVAKGIIENWVKTTMLIAQAERNLPDSLKDFSKELEAEKNSLLIYTYENQYIGEKLDTIVSQAEIDSYYAENKSSFVLSDYILQYAMVQASISNEAIQTADVKRLLAKAITEPDELLSYCSDIGAAYVNDTNKWWYLEEFLETVPVEVYNNESFLKKQKFTSFETENFKYFVYLIDYKLKNAEAPLELVSDKIKTLILNRRKLATLKKLKADLYQKAVRDNHIKYYE
ncbi:MAG: hypothetical protein AB8B53_08695 [Flavobacteriales bacterium]